LFILFDNISVRLKLYWNNSTAVANIFYAYLILT